MVGINPKGDVMKLALKIALCGVVALAIMQVVFQYTGIKNPRIAKTEQNVILIAGGQGGGGP